MGKSILILGCNGFIGRSVTEYFEAAKSEIAPNGYDVTALSHRDLEILDGKAVREYFSVHSYDVVIDTAVWNPANASAVEAPREVEMNLRMFLNVARCADSFGRMVYFGSGAEYDKQRDIVNAREEELETIGVSCGGLASDIELPATTYGFSKRVIGQMIENYDNIYNLRVFGLYGPYEDYRIKFITGCCAKAVLGLPLTIRQNVFFDYLYIDDFCSMLERFINLDAPQHHTYNIVSGSRIDLLTLAEYVRELSGKNLPIYVCREGLAKEYTACGDRLHDEIDYHDIVGHKEAIGRLLEYFEEHKAEIDMQELLYQ